MGLWTNWGWISGIRRRAFSLEMMSDEKGEEKHFKETQFKKKHVEKAQWFDSVRTEEVLISRSIKNIKNP